MNHFLYPKNSSAVNLSVYSVVRLFQKVIQLESVLWYYMYVISKYVLWQSV